jgi:hypothetical protein
VWDVADDSLPFQRHSPTSEEAAERHEPRARTERARVLDAIRKSVEDGLTDEECQDALLMNPSTQRPRRVELVKGGFVVDSGRTRPTHAGYPAAVWIAT